ncbi:hypothetical protein [Pseudoalteromonas luteoviolacea]|uniref:DUF4124 domain-containing protein n=1 Tax=Pseudoalteromonas luteoviolacea S4054 TaxID=1129367 RepID=A0A0F6ABV5_9GAMM|nr:hypothetical protein [Pseudoalteromonas luteoviolacea]AOT09003.1 hypothetical protein S4054249_14535 [Pseudoalteromonas luteoviolacea]AOT13915.1 hypothetical protein S40542_14505 [Pseudoalteromonas luteoviolacea]AOT18830.1 hypothetical protein S4054_14510 [Pseudoalteromonas luteoviolacea]KKE83638.1 hypothetical protein N479_01010 [Pseudoalteromonas luteoviolacea S4054]KZN63423.1 hypothetical protein N481_25665 [Pseudoalteromonas luteoviolacea S4047-1]
MRFALILILLLFFNNSDAKTTVSYYKCVTDKSTIFSQHPCSNSAQQYTLTHSDPQAKIPSEQHFKTLNEIERKQIIHNLKNALRAKKQHAAILGRKRDEAAREQQRRVTRLMDDDKRKATVKDVKKQLKSINKDYLQRVKVLNKEIAKIEKKLKRLQ